MHITQNYQFTGWLWNVTIMFETYHSKAAVTPDKYELGSKYLASTYAKSKYSLHHDVIRWKHFPRYWPFVRGIHGSPMNSPHKGHWRGSFMFALICALHVWVNNREVGDFRRHRANYEVIVMDRELIERGFSILTPDPSDTSTGTILGICTYCIDVLTHWGRVTHICVSKLTSIGSDNDLLPGRMLDYC